ncbi:ArsC/Spx/MgsR family protein [Streptomyces inhibens]|uniref:ArsC/Spx/MgsR family protein n=1 Tax=Streptomyces inhibens TaxID=2293571 RepID=UPI001EE76B96|nr:ArsC/Spx/MgsR family protein [Streptomyces inhibens]UKY54133.1 arsenate reductase family protein [Streptomyces inhibens]
MLEIWHNRDCPTSVRILENLGKKQLPHQGREYMVDSPDSADIDILLDKLGAQPWAVVRMHDPIAQQLGLEEWPHDRQRWIDALVDHPILLQRPIVIRDDGRAAIVRSVEALDEFLAAEE